MLNAMQKTLISKEVRGVVRSQGFFTNYLLVPLIMSLIIPVGIVVAIGVFGVEITDFEDMFTMLAVTIPAYGAELVVIEMVMDFMMPMLFLMIPPLIVVAMAASSFTGEKERRTLETLLYTPMNLKQIFTAKIIASWTVGMIVTLVSFVVMMGSVMGLVWLMLGEVYVPNLSWFVIIVILAPAFALFGIILQIRISAKAKSSEEAYQRGGVIVLPLVLILGSQLSGIIFIGPTGFLIMGATLIGLSWILMKVTLRKMTYERLLK